VLAVAGAHDRILVAYGMPTPHDALTPMNEIVLLSADLKMAPGVGQLATGSSLRVTL